jgi:murein DD-endopeptidase MepM/ murein hydrolase activator NlpD
VVAVIRKTLTVLAAVLIASCSEAPISAPAPSAGTDVQLQAELRTASAQVLRGATLAALLRSHDTADAELSALVTRIAAVFDLRKFRAEQPYRIAQARGKVRWFEYEIDVDRLLMVTRADDETDGSFVAEIVPIKKTARVVVVRGAVDDAAPSLYAAMDRAGETVDLSVKLADIFASDVDFNTELQPGDRFELLVEKHYREDGRFGGYGPILAAELDNDGRSLRAIRFTPDGESPGYFDEHGRSLRRFFLRSPLKFDPVVTSAFSRRRLHPVLHEYRAHLGVDYRAPTGAPVIAVASGVVVAAGWSGGSGRMVHLRHANGFETQYLHLSSVAVRRGARVQQGDLIGRVGSSGLATGPHLDYRLKKSGAYINPITAHRAMPPGDPIPASQLDAFARVRDRTLEALSEPPAVAAAANEH